MHARVSTRDQGQDPENRVPPLRAFAEPPGTVYPVFAEEVCGGHSDRNEFKQLMLEACQKKVDLVVFWRLDRFRREEALPTRRYRKELKNLGVNDGSFPASYLDSLGPFGDVLVSTRATLATQGLLQISENTEADRAPKKAAGVQLGAPHHSPGRGRPGALAERRGPVERRLRPRAECFPEPSS